MLNFYRLRPVNYKLEDQTDCLPGQDPDLCKQVEEYKMPIMPGDVLQFIVPKFDILYTGFSASDIKVGLSNCGILVTEDIDGNDISVIGTVEEGDSETHLYITVTIPNVPDCGNYELLFYTDYDAVNCELFAGFTWEDMCETDYRIGDLCGCSFDNMC